MNCSENMKPKPRPKWPKIDIRPILKYLALTLLGFLLFKMAAKQARIDRGYSAVGGEAMFLLLPSDLLSDFCNRPGLAGRFEK